MTQADAALNRLNSLIAENRPRARELVERVQNTIIDDYTREPKDIHFHTDSYAIRPDDFVPAGGTWPDTLVMGFRSSKLPMYKIHPHALGQLADRLKIENGYVRRLNADSPSNWRRILLQDNFNMLMHHTEFAKRGDSPMRFLLRFVGDELRGFMSRSFGRHLASKPMLAAFLSACNAAGAQPTDAISTHVKNTLSCYLPQVFETPDKEHVAIGVRWANSDFGAGKLTVSLCLLSVNRKTSVVLSDEYSKVHIGSIIPEGDLEISDATAAKEVEAAASAIKDAVDSQLRPESVERLLNAITLAQEQKVDWATLRRDLKKFLYEGELAAFDVAAEKGIRDLAPSGIGSDGKPLPTKWWTLNVLSLLADNEVDAERKIELQQEAGKYLEIKK